MPSTAGSWLNRWPLRYRCFGMTRGGATCFSDREAVARTVPPGAAMLPWGEEATTKEVFC